MSKPNAVVMSAVNKLVYGDTGSCLLYGGNAESCRDLVANIVAACKAMGITPIVSEADGVPFRIVHGPAVIQISHGKGKG